MPADHGGRFDDQHHASEPRPIKGSRQQSEDGSVRRGEPGAVNLPLQHQDLMAKSDDLGVTLAATHQQQSETRDQEPEQLRKVPITGSVGRRDCCTLTERLGATTAAMGKRRPWWRRDECCGSLDSAGPMEAGDRSRPLNPGERGCYWCSDHTARSLRSVSDGAHRPTPVPFRFC